MAFRFHLKVEENRRNREGGPLKGYVLTAHYSLENAIKKMKSLFGDNYGGWSVYVFDTAEDRIVYPESLVSERDSTSEKVAVYTCQECGWMIDPETALTHRMVGWGGPGDKLPYHRWGHQPARLMMLEFVPLHAVSDQVRSIAQGIEQLGLHA